MATITCPHCNLAQEEGGQFCSSCGKALPSAVPSGPRRVTGNAVAATAVGKTVQADELRKTAGKAFGALLAVSVLSVIGGVVLYYLLMRVGSAEAERMASILLAVNIVLAAVFAGLAAWARFNPLPAAIAGLVLFVSVHLVNAALDPTSIVQGIVVKVIVIVVLIKAIQAGIKHKQLRDQMRAA